ncbi:MAG TPA: acyltransferase [Polyangiaceae bacterium]|jgi:peptidoglycan/LPS O-acetylase OafA/YrhL
MSAKLPGLDGLRALAAVAVFVDHAEQTQEWVGGNAWDGNQMTSLGRQGVEVFFVLSGFLITRLLLRERDHTGTVSLPRFYARRTLRIWPLYYLVVLLAWVALPWAVHLLPAQVQALCALQTRTMGSPGDPRLPLYLLFLANFSFWLCPHVLCGAHLWSLGVEEQFYVVWPVVFRWTRRPLLVFGAIVAAKVGLHMAIEYDHGLVSWFLSESSIFLALEFSKMCHYEAMAVGAAAAYVAFHHRDAVRRVADAWWAPLVAWSLLAGCVYLAGWNQGFHGIDPITELPMLGYAVVVLLVSHRSRRSLLLDNPAVAWLGARSYGFYMLHTFAMVIAAALLERAHVARAGALPHALFYVVAFALAAGAAGLSYRLVEEPFLRLKERRFGGVRA